MLIALDLSNLTDDFWWWKDSWFWDWWKLTFWNQWVGVRISSGILIFWNPSVAIQPHFDPKILSVFHHDTVLRKIGHSKAIRYGPYPIWWGEFFDRIKYIGPRYQITEVFFMEFCLRWIYIWRPKIQGVISQMSFSG